MRPAFIAFFMLCSLSFLRCQEVVTKLDDGDTTPFEKLLYLDQMEWTSKGDLRLVRNAIYARYGNIFQDNDLKAYFGKFSWYKARSSNVDKQLTAIDRANVKLVRRIEDNFPTEESLQAGIIGI